MTPQEDDDLLGTYQQHATDGNTPRRLELPDFAIRYRDPVDNEIKTGPAPCFMLLPASDVSRAFAAAHQRGIRHNLKPKNITPDIVEAMRAEDRVTYVKHLVRGWDNIIDATGAAVPYSAAAALEFFTGKRLNKRTGRDEYIMPDVMFVAIRDYCLDTTNFASIDVETIAKK